MLTLYPFLKIRHLFENKEKNSSMNLLINNLRNVVLPQPFLPTSAILLSIVNEKLRFLNNIFFGS